MAFLRLLEGREEWARFHGRMLAKETGGRVPAPTKWHEPEADLYPGLAAHPFHAPSDEWYHKRVAAAVAHLERFFPVIKEEMLNLRATQLQQYRQPNTAIQDRELSADGTMALLTDSGDWKVLYLQLEGQDTKEQCKQAPKTAKIVRSVPRCSGHALCAPASLMPSKRNVLCTDRVPGSHAHAFIAPCHSFRARPRNSHSAALRAVELPAPSPPWSSDPTGCSLPSPEPTHLTPAHHQHTSMTQL